MVGNSGNEPQPRYACLWIVASIRRASEPHWPTAVAAMHVDQWGGLTDMPHRRRVFNRLTVDDTA